MKKYLHLINAIIIVVILFSCKKSGKEMFEINFFPVKSGENFQYIDKEGKIIINPQFKNACIFRNGNALVQTSGENPKWGYIGEDGKYIINANYKRATIFSDDLAWVVSDNAAPTAINIKGEIKITLQDAQTVTIFKEGLAAFSVADSSGQIWGFVDKSGKIKINPQFLSTGKFNNGKCAVENKEGKWGYIDKEGKIVINYQFDYAKEFINGKAIVKSGEKAGLIDENGKYLINPQFSDMANDNEMFLIEKDGKWGWCDKDGKITINPQFSEAFPFLGNDLAAVQSGKSYGYINKDGKIVINPQFDAALPFNGKIALVMSAKKVGFIDKEGKYIINPQFDEVSDDLSLYLLNGSSEFESVVTDKITPPEIVAKEFLTALNKMDYDKAKTFGTEETGKMVDMIKSFSTMGGDEAKLDEAKKKVEKAEIEISKTDLIGDTVAVCQYKVTGIEGQEPKEDKIDLVKRDGKWLVNWKKEGMGS